MIFNILYSSIMFIGENWKLFWIIGAETKKKFFSGRTGRGRKGVDKVVI